MKHLIVTTFVAAILFTGCDCQIVSQPATTTQRRPSLVTRKIASTTAQTRQSTTANTDSIFGNFECGKTFGNLLTMSPHFEWTAYISSDYGACGGALLSREWVLTAAHCIFADGVIARDVDVEIGRDRIEDPRNQAVKRKAAHVNKHPLFDNSLSLGRVANYSYDFALLKLDRPVDFTAFIKPICLPDSSRCSFEDDDATVDSCSEIAVTGWGLSYDAEDFDFKRYNLLTIQRPSECRRKWGVGDANICAGPAYEFMSQCIPTSGSPAFCEINRRQTVVGIVSFGANNCSISEAQPTALARVCKVLPWIQSIVKEHASPETELSQSSTTRQSARRPIVITQRQSANTTPAPRQAANADSIFGALECGLSVDSRIVGENAISRHYPWTASVSIHYGECGGALLSQEWVLTAGHCILQGDKIVQDVDIELAKRQTNAQGVKRKAALVIKHPVFDNSWSSNFAHDFALLKLDQPVNFTDDIKPICLPDSSRCSFEENVATVDGCSEITVAGWDGVSGVSDVFSVKRPSECRRQFNVGDANICGTTNQSDTCSGNGGRPAFCQHNGRQTVIGVVSFGLANCDPSDPLAFARVCKVLPWIQTTVQAYSNDDVANRNPTTRQISTTRLTTKGPSATTGRQQANRSPAPSPTVKTSSIFDNLECGLFIDSRMGGKGSVKPQNPWMVLISQDFAVCGGAVLSREWVLTAASCISNDGEIVEEVDIKFGKDRIRDENNQAVQRKATRVIKHPLFERFSYDFALVKLDRPVDYADDIKPICVPDSSSCSFEENVATIDGCSSMNVAGWSVTADGSPVLRYKKVSVFTPAECRRKLGTGDVNICAGNNTDASYTCRGDSGSPASCLHNGRQTVVGVVSFGTANCDPSYPTGFARVCKVLPWIQATVQEHATAATATLSSTTRRSATAPRRR